MKDLVIVGVGGHGREVAQWVRDINAHQSTWNLLGFVDDAADVPEYVHQLPVLGSIRWLAGRDCWVVIAIGKPAIRRRVAHELRSAGITRFSTIVHPDAKIGMNVEVGEGSMICANARLTTDIRVGDHVIVNTGAVVTHDCVLDDFVSLAPNAILSGATILDMGVDWGTAAISVPGVHVGEWSVVGAGAVVTEEVSPNAVVAGVPARLLQQRHAGWQDAT